MKEVKRILVFALATAILISAAGCATTTTASPSPTEETLQTVTAGKLTMATNAQFPPYEYYDNGEVVGIDVEIAQAVAEKLGLELVIDDMEFPSIVASVQTGKADVGIAAMTILEERLESVDFSDVYATGTQAIIIRKDNTEITGTDDLVGKKIGVQLGTTGDIYAGDVQDATVERYDKGYDAVLALQQGKIDAVIIDDQPAKIFESQNTDIVVLDEPFTVEDYAIAVSKDNSALTAKINEAIAELKESGELQAIIDKYISAE